MDAIIHTPFAEIAILLVMAAAIGLFGILLRQPLIVSFIAVGLIAGPSALDVVRSDEQIGLLSELGIAVLLFLVGITPLGPWTQANPILIVALTTLWFRGIDSAPVASLGRGARGRNGRRTGAA